MSSDIKMKISIPSDNDGFILMKCPTCCEEFMLLTRDIKDDSLIDIWCPGCGIKNLSYIREDVQLLAERMIDNFVADTLNDFSKDLSKMFRNSKSIKFKPGKKIKKEAELPIGRTMGDFILKSYYCCDKDAKIINYRQFIGGYCPFCGEMIDGN